MPPADSIWYILDKIQKDIDRIDEKWDSHLVSSTKLLTNLDNVSVKVAELNKLLTQDNGKPSIVSQLSIVSNQLKTLSADVGELQKHLGIKTPKEVSIERWKTVGKLGVAIIAVLPGILSFFSTFL